MGGLELSVVVCTHDNADRLRATLADLARQRVAATVRWELVLVNNACADDTDAAAADFAESLPLRYLHEPRPGKSRALNRALARARGELIVFTDDDVVLRPDWLAQYWRAYTRGPADRFFGSSVRSRYEGPEPSAALRRIAPPSVVGLELGSDARPLGRGEGFIGANWAAPAAAIDRAGGFDVTLGLNAHRGRVCVGEETELMDRLRRAGWRPWVVPEARIEHRVPQSKCTREHIVARRVAQFRDEVLRRHGARHRVAGAARAIGRWAWLCVQARVAPLVGRTGLLSRAQARAHREAALMLLRTRNQELFRIATPSATARPPNQGASDGGPAAA